MIIREFLFNFLVPYSREKKFKFKRDGWKYFWHRGKFQFNFREISEIFWCWNWFIFFFKIIWLTALFFLLLHLRRKWKKSLVCSVIRDGNLWLFLIFQINFEIQILDLRQFLLKIVYHWSLWGIIKATTNMRWVSITKPTLEID